MQSDRPVLTEDMVQLVRGLQHELSLHGYQMLETPIIQPADLFLTRAGDQIIDKLFTFERNGQQLALRPEFTAAAAHRFAQPNAPKIARWQFSGIVFEDHPGTFSSTYQKFSIGAELIGMSGPAADAEMMSLATRGLVQQQLPDWHLSIGHTGLMRHLLSPFHLDSRTERFLLGRITTLRKEGKAAVLAQVDQSLVLAPSTADQELTRPDASAISLTELNTHEMLQVLLDATERGGTMGGRTRQDIARRLLQKRQRYFERQQIVEALDFLEQWSSISGPVESAFEALHQLVPADDDDGQKLLADWRAAVDLLAAYEIPPERVLIQPHIARSWDYYTGIVFELEIGSGQHVGGGGRYDELIALVGGGSAVPAVGFAYFVEDILAHQVNQTQAHPEYVIVLLNDSNALAASRVAHQLRTYGLVTMLGSEDTPPSGVCIEVRPDGSLRMNGTAYTAQQVEQLAADIQRKHS